MRFRAFIFALLLAPSLPAAIQECPSWGSWEGVTISHTAGSDRWYVLKKSAGFNLTIYVSPTNGCPADLLVVSNTTECLCIDARAAFEAGATKVLMGYPGVENVKQYYGEDVIFVTEWSGSDYVPGVPYASVKTFLNGGDANGNHWYRYGTFSPRSRRREYRAVTTIEDGVKNLGWRFDIDQPGAGEIRLYRARLGLYSELEQKHPDYGEQKLTFHASFDNTNATADVGLGGCEPVLDKNLTFPAGLHGRALLVGPTGCLAYSAPDNLRSECGTMSFWYKSQFQPDTEHQRWQCILEMPTPEHAGSIAGPTDGSLWFWWWNRALRRDLGDVDAAYSTLSSSYYPSDNEQWHHYVIVWNAAGSSVYVDGGVNVTTGDKSAPQVTALNTVVTLKDFDRSKSTFPKFWLGCMSNSSMDGAGYQNRGLLDEVKIWSAPMTEDEALALYDAEQDAKLSLADEYGTAGVAETLRLTVAAQNGRGLTGFVPILVDSNNVTVATGAPLDATGGVRTISATLPVGDYEVTLAPKDGETPVVKCVSYWVLAAGNSAEGETTSSSGEISEKELLYTIVPSNGMPSASFCAVGTCTEGSLSGTNYLETGLNQNDRFALRLSFDTADPLHLVEIDYPDDRKRTMDIVIQDAKSPNSDYTMQVGVYTGGELPLSGRILTHRCLYWTRAADAALIVTGARANEPAAVSAVRVYRVTGGKLPVARTDPTVRSPAGWGRHVGSYWEDPAIGYDFACGQTTAAAFGTLVERMSAYLKFTGRDVLAFPGVFYHGILSHGNYTTRDLPHHFLQGWFRKFDEEDLFFVPTVNLQTIPFPEGVCTRGTMRDGTLHPTSLAIFDTGTPNWGGWHGTPPYFNIAHTNVQAEIEAIFDALIADGRDHPSFKGICLHLTTINCLWWGSLQCGYNDYNIMDFEKATGITVGVEDRTAALRGKDYAAWLKANAYDAWVAWRCGVVTEFYARLAAKLRAARSDLKLWINPHVPLDPTDADYGTVGYNERLLREAGLDTVSLAAAIPNLVIGSTISPADWRKGTLGGSTAELKEISRTIQNSPDMTSHYVEGSYTWSQFHDRYWENSVGEGSTALKSDWLTETTWRVTTLNPSGRNALEPYAKALANRDVKGFSRGGFLIGSYGMEPLLARFAQAVRALPTNDFETVSAADGVVERRATAQGRTWTYLVNATNEARTVTTTAERGSWDLATGDRLDSRTVTLEPYELRAFADLSDSEYASLRWDPDPRGGTTVWQVGTNATAFVQDGVLYVRGTGAVTLTPWLEKKGALSSRGVRTADASQAESAATIAKVKVAEGITTLPAGAFDGLEGLSEVNGMTLSAFNAAAAGAVATGDRTIAIDPATKTGTFSFRVLKATDVDAPDEDWTAVDASGATVSGTEIRVPVPADTPTGFFRVR